MKFTVIYLRCDHFPRITFKKEYEAVNAAMAMHLFVNESVHDDYFVAAIVECPSSAVHYAT